MQGVNLCDKKSLTNFPIVSEVMSSFFSYINFFPLGISRITKNGRSSPNPIMSRTESHISAYFTKWRKERTNGSFINIIINFNSKKYVFTQFIYFCI